MRHRFEQGDVTVVPGMKTPRLPSGGAYGKTGEYMAKVGRNFDAR